ncbi:MAG: AI-2E family transporter [Caldilineaceae bacterium]
MNSRRWSNVTKIIVIVALVILAIALMVTFGEMISPTIVAFLLAFILSRPVNWIQKQTGWARGACVAFLYILLLALVALMPALFISRSVAIFMSLRQTLEELIANLRSTPTRLLFVFGTYQLSAGTLLKQMGDVLQNVLAVATADPFSLFRGVTTGILTVIYVLVLNFWLLKDSQKFQRVIFEQIPTDYQEDVRRLGQELGKIWHAFLRGQLILSLVVGSMVWVALLIVGMPNAAGLALLAGVMEFLPQLGTGVSTTIGTTVALFQGSVWLPVNHITFTVIVFVIYVIIAQLEHVYLIPRFVGGRVKLHPAVTFVGIINGAIAFGVLGVLLATPVIASARVIFSYMYRKILDLEPFEPLPSTQIGVRIRGLIAGRKIEAVIFDLDGVLTPVDMQFADWTISHLRWLDPLIPQQQRWRLIHGFMIGSEGMVNFMISQLEHLELQQDLKRLMPFLNRLRGYVAPQQMKPTLDIVDSLQELATRYRLGLVSTRDCETIHCFLARSGIDSHLFEVIIGQEDVRHLLPHSESLLIMVNRLKLEPNQMLMVSDTDTNLRASRAMEMATAGVLWGLGREQDMREADLVLAHVTELLDYL